MEPLTEEELAFIVDAGLKAGLSEEEIVAKILAILRPQQLRAAIPQPAAPAADATLAGAQRADLQPASAADQASADQAINAALLALPAVAAGAAAPTMLPAMGVRGLQTLTPFAGPATRSVLGPLAKYAAKRALPWLGGGLVGGYAAKRLGL